MNYTEDYSQEGLLKAHILHSIAPTAIYMFRRDQLLKTEGSEKCRLDRILF